MMLAKELKIKNLRKQRLYIRDQLLKTDRNPTGNTSIIYVGSIFPENIGFFKHEGFHIYEVKLGDQMQVATKGMPVYLISSAEIELTINELHIAESVESKAERIEKATDSIGSGFDELFKGLFDQRIDPL